MNKQTGLSVSCRHESEQLKTTRMDATSTKRRNRNLTHPIGVLFGFLALWSQLVPSAIADPWADLSANDPAKQQAAFEQLSHEGASTRQKLVEELLTLRRQAWFDAARAAKAAQNLFVFRREAHSTSQPTRLRKLYDDWQSAGQSLRAFLFDPQGVYQVPGGDASRWRPGVDVQPGQDEVERRTGAAISAWNAWWEAVEEKKPGGENGTEKAATQTAPARVLSAPILVYRIHDPRAWCDANLGQEAGREGVVVRLVRQYRTAVGRYERLTRWLNQLAIPLPQDAKPLPLPAMDGLCVVLGQLVEDRPIGPPPAATNGLSEDENRMVSLVALALQGGGTPPAQTGGQGRNVWRTLQLYRLACGLAPLRWNEKLAKAAREHAQDMQERSFFSHQSPVPGKATLADRLAKAGFTGKGGECLDQGTLGPNGENAVWRWRADAEHHRLLLSDQYDWGAIGGADKITVLLVGRENK